MNTLTNETIESHIEIHTGFTGNFGPIGEIGEYYDTFEFGFNMPIAIVCIFTGLISLTLYHDAVYGPSLYL